MSHIVSNFSCRTRTERAEDCNRRAAPDSRLRKESAIAGSDRYSSRDASARPIRKSGRGATRRGPQAGARATHRGHTHTTHVRTGTRLGIASKDRFVAGTRRQGHGRHRRTYCQGGDSDWAALRALRAVEARPGSWAKIASTHESGFGEKRTQRAAPSAVTPVRSKIC